MKLGGYYLEFEHHADVGTSRAFLYLDPMDEPLDWVEVAVYYKDRFSRKGGRRACMMKMLDPNNSGGGFDFDAAKGISHHVIIEASNKAAADARAQEVGLYFDGVETGQDCECCGDRWGSPYDDEVHEDPKVYGEVVTPYSAFPAEDEKHRYSIKWMKGEPEGFIHYLDGKIVPFWV